VVQDSLAAGTPKFKLWKTAELPFEWAAEPDDRQWAEAARQLGNSTVRMAKSRLQACVVLELPDTKWGRSYYFWALKELETKPAGEFLQCMLTNMHDFRGPHEPEQTPGTIPSGARFAAARCLQELLLTGKPPGHFARVWGPKAA
jgi:hypothetical protein